jgi:hypothetical protein
MSEEAMTDYRELEKRLRKRHLLGDCVLAADAIKALREGNERMMKALINYAVHPRGCIPQVVCTCGLDAALSPTAPRDGEKGE